jgi:3-hydroxyisobutyrate dehydrogenase-like beta-hydroxyacid dehydrogenase
MGKPMARNLIRSGFGVTVYNRSAPPVTELSREGAKVASSPSEVGMASDVVLLSLPSTDSVREVVLGAKGIVEGMKAPGVIIDTSTIDPEASRSIGKRLAEKGLRFLDAPVSGGPEGAAKATLTFMVGGPKDVFDECQEVFRTLGSNIFYMGESGSGQATKLVNQLLVTVHTLATAEGLKLGAGQGLDLEKVVEVIRTSAGDSFVFRRAGPAMISREFGSGWQTWVMNKDLGLILDSASQMNLELSLAKVTAQTFAKAVERGLGKTDSAAIITTI